MKEVRIVSIPHNKHRYLTVGDWYEALDENLRSVIHIDVSQMSDKRYEILVAIHELVEKVLCDEAGITEAEVDKFDVEFDEKKRYLEKTIYEHERELYVLNKIEQSNSPRAVEIREHLILYKKDLNSLFDEAGNDPNAPYHRQHRIADVIERLLAVELGVDWNDYEKEIMNF